MTTSKSMMDTRIGKTAFTIQLLFTLFLVTACGGSTRLNSTMSMANASPDRHRQVTLSAPELRKILLNHFGNVDIKLADDQYILPENSKVTEINDYAHCTPYAANSTNTANWDCDDYTIAAMVPMRNYAFGAMYVKTAGGQSHALNVFVNRNKEVKYWEPQTCDYYQGQFHRPNLLVF